MKKKYTTIFIVFYTAIIILYSFPFLHNTHSENCELNTLCPCTNQCTSLHQQKHKINLQRSSFCIACYFNAQTINFNFLVISTILLISLTSKSVKELFVYFIYRYFKIIRAPPCFFLLN